MKTHCTCGSFLFLKESQELGKCQTCRGEAPTVTEWEPLKAELDYESSLNDCSAKAPYFRGAIAPSFTPTLMNSKLFVLGLLVASAMPLASVHAEMPLNLRPNAVQECADPSFHFVTSSQGGGVQPDTTNAKTSFCVQVKKNVELWKK